MFSFRSSHCTSSVKKDVLKNFADFTGKHLCWNIFLIHTCFPVKFANFSRTSFSKNIWERLLLRKLEAVVQKCSVKKVFLEISQNSQENTCARVSFLQMKRWNQKAKNAKMESIQCNACLAITGAIRGTSREKIYQELGLESLQLRPWYRKLCLFYKVFKNQHPKYLFFPVCYYWME